MRPANLFVFALTLASSASPNLVGLTVSLGSTVTLPCDGAPGREVEWYFKQHDHEDSDWMLVAELHTGAFSPGSGFQGRVKSFHRTEPGNYSLILSPVVYSDLGFYECRYKDGTDTFLKDVRLNILVPSLVSVEMGMPATLPCFGNIDKRARAGDLDILWTRGGQKFYHLHKNTITYGLGFENRVSFSPEQALHGNLSLTIKQTQSSDEGDYQCTYNSAKERGKPHSATLAFAAPPPCTGLSAGAVVWIVAAFLGGMALGAGGFFAVSKYLNKGKQAELEVPCQAASAEEQNKFNCKTARILDLDIREPHQSEPETEPESCLVSILGPSATKPHLLVPKKDPSFPEPHPPEPEMD